MTDIYKKILANYSPPNNIYELFLCETVHNIQKLPRHQLQVFE